MNSIFKRIIFLWTILFTTILFAKDGEDIEIFIHNAPSVHEDSGSMSFTIELSEAPDWCDELTVNYTTADGSATAGEDYTAKSGSVTFYGACLMPTHLPQSSKTVTVDITNTPETYEPNEYLNMNISNSTIGYTVTDDSGYGYIIDNNPVPFKLTLHNRSETEQDSNWVLNFTARLNQPAPAGGITVDYTTQDSSAIAGDDYIATSGSITIAEGDRDGFIPVTIIGDTLPEPTDRENFRVKITSISQGSVTNTNSEAKATITDDDRVKVDISSSDVNEGNSGDSNKMEFKIFLAKDYPNIADLTINYTTEDGSDPSATLANSDYIKTSGSVTFTHGDREKSIYVPIVGDDTIEPDELLKMVISGDNIINDGESESEIINDDGSYPSVDFSTGDVSIVEGNSSTKILNFHFTLDADALAGSSFDYYTQDDEAEVLDNDYAKIDITTYNIPEGTRDINIPVTIIGDTKIEEDESFSLKFTNEKNITITGHEANGHILNDDGAYPNLTFDMDSYSTGEGDSGQKDINFSITLDAPAMVGSSFDYYTQDNTAQVSDSDYDEITRKTYLIPQGETQITIPVKINGDTDIEDDESFYLKIDNEHNLTISGTQSPRGEIINDDGSFSEFSIEALVTKGTEGNSGTKNLVFTIKLDTNATEDGVSIQYQTVDGTARDSDNDYEKIPTTTVIFNKGEIEKTLFVKMNGDTKVEDNETFYVELLNPHRATLSEDNSSVEFTIINDDEHNDDPFECRDNDMYISSSTNRETGDTGKMWLHRIDTTQNPFVFQVINKDGANEIYNATAYNPDDNYIYGLYNRELIKLSKTGKVTNLGVIAGLPDRFDNKQLYAGAIYGGSYYVSGRRTKLNKLYKIDLDNNNSVSVITLSQKVVIKDFAFSSDGTYLYGIEKNGKLIRIRVSDGDTVKIGEEHDGYIFDSTFSDKNNRLFANDGEGNGFFEFDLTTGEKQFLSNSQPATYNDGANCLNASLVFTDYGDAPSSYGEASHDIRGGIFMGEEVDHDINPYFSEEANGDDSNGIDDEDGVTLANGEDINGSYFKLNSEQNLTIKVSKDGYLNAWIDYNIDGDFDDMGEKIFSALSLSEGTHTLNINVPDGLVENKTSYIRFRYSSTPNLTATQSATDGEVEDYAIKFGDGVVPLRGVFNIERTDSGTYPIDSDARNAWYTQVVGRDFNYSIVFYKENLSAQKEIDNVTIKLELVNMENNSSLYERYFHIKNDPAISRKDIMIDTDLDALPAVKDARFRISYGVADDGSILAVNCEKSEEECFNELPNIRTNYAKDNFAIRPETFYVTVHDKSNILRNSRAINPKALRLGAGYEYNLTVVATQYRFDHTVVSSPDYNTSIDRWLHFITQGVCANSDDNLSREIFKDGNNTTNLIQMNEVGTYRLDIKDENWTAVDQNHTNPELSDCLLGADIERFRPNSEGKVGCTIKTSIYDMNLSFQPYKFKIELPMEEDNIPKSSHPDFLYMMNNISGDNSDVAIQFEGNITAQAKGDINTKNFTKGCVARDINLSLIADTLSEDGINKIIRTSPSNSRVRSRVNFTRIIRYNKDIDINNLDTNRVLERINSDINISANRFLNENNGTVYLQIRYNLNKNGSQTINPVQITFKSFESNATKSFSESNGSTPYYPIGHQNLEDTIRNFYFAQVAPDRVVYPMVNCLTHSTISTPVNVDIFCDKNLTYCTQTGVMAHTDPLSSPRASGGFYSSIDHNQTVDGDIKKLEHTAFIRTNPNPSTANPLEFTQGRNGMLTTKFIRETKERISIIPSDALLYHPNPLKNGHPEYEVSCSNDYNSSQWTGVGKTGNALDIKSNVKRSYKMDW